METKQMSSDWLELKKKISALLLESLDEDNSLRIDLAIKMEEKNLRVEDFELNSREILLFELLLEESFGKEIELQPLSKMPIHDFFEIFDEKV